MLVYLIIVLTFEDVESKICHQIWASLQGHWCLKQISKGDKLDSQVGIVSFLHLIIPGGGEHGGYVFKISHSLTDFFLAIFQILYSSIFQKNKLKKFIIL